MKNKISIILLLAIMISLVACFNIYTGPAPTTGTTEPGVTPTVTTTVTTTPPTTSPTTTPTLSPTVKPTGTPKITIIPSITPTILVPFEDKTWVLEQYGKQSSLQVVIEGKEPTVKFDSATGKVGGSAGCNGFNGSYTKDKDKITVTGITATMMLCMPNTVMQQETEFFSELRGAESYRVVGGKLEIYCTESRLLIFKPK